MVKSGRNKEVPETAQFQTGGWGTMQDFVLSGKASTVFRLIELKVQREEAEKARKKQEAKKRKQA